MAWRVARSLETLTAEIRALHPGTTVWTIGDASHAASASDHNPNSAGVVCAADVLGNAGLDLAWFAERVKASGHPAMKYVIFNRRIWSKARAGEGWRPYNGSNPHTTHVHVSVGVGPDGRSTGPYDDTSPWGIDGPTGGSDVNTRQLQESLKAAGYDPGPIDGIWGPKTQAALVAALKGGKTGPKGDPGQAGPRGPAGPPGKDGRDGLGAGDKVTITLTGAVIGE